MATLEQIGQALQAADSAGAADDARRLARLYKDTQDMQRMANPTGTGVENFLAGAGKALTDIGRGAGQLVGMGPSGSEVAEQRRLDAPLMRTGGGVTGNIAGNIAATLPTMAIPGINTYTGAALMGAGMGALQPVERGSERLLNTGLGVGSGLAGQAIGNTLSRAVRPVQSALPAEEQRLAQVALKEGIPLDVSSATGSKPLKTINAVMENLPFTAGGEAAKRQATNEAFTAAALRRAGIQGAEATPDVLLAQKGTLGKTFEDIASRNSMDLNKGVVDKLADISHEATRRLAKPGPVINTVDDILKDASNGILDGSKYQGWRSELGRLAKGTDSEAHYFGQVKKALDQAFSSQVSKGDAEAFKQVSREYANLKTIMQAMGSPSATSGQIPPAQLSAALRGAMGKEGIALGRGDLNDLVRVGQKFVKPQIPDSGTAQRYLYQSLLTGGGASLGAGGALATGHDPLEGAMYGAGATAASLAGPRLAQMLINNPTLQSYAIEQSMNPIAAQLARILQTSGRTLGASVPFALEKM